MTQETIQEIELNIRQAQKIIDLGASVDRLLNNRDFKKVVMETYFEKEAVRLVHLKADPAMQAAEHQEAIDRQMRAIGEFHQFLRNLGRHAEMARRSLAADEEMRQEILAEENE